jgi:ATP-binding cassette subfamily C protein CydCD
MYFDLRLWRMTRGMRLAMLGGVALGLLALAVGIARFAFLGVAQVALPLAAAGTGCGADAG